MRTAICTIIAKNYLPFARVLMASVRWWVPEALRIVILVDRVDGYFDPAAEDFELILSEDLGLPNSRWFHFKYTILELSTAVKPYALKFLFHRYQLERLIYLDPDVKIYGTMRPLLDMLSQDSIILTPHLTEALDDQLRPSELDILRSGSYNLGFIALSASAETTRFLNWWKAKVYDQCVVDLARGLFVDQRWVDLVPGLFEGVRILREPGYNVAYWNLKHRHVERTESGWLVNGRPLCFFHFSGFDPENPSQFSRHQDRYRLGDLGDAQSLVLDYRDELLAHGYSECKNWPYAYGSFQNGFPIPDIGRPLHHEDPELVARVEDPFSEEGFRAFLDVWNQPIVSLNGERPGVTRLAYRIYRTRSDVQAAMPDIFGGDLIRFLEWILSTGRSEHGLDQAFLAPVWDALQAARRHERVHSDLPLEEDRPGEGRRGLPPRHQAVLKGSTASLWINHGAEADVAEKLNELMDAGSAGLRLSRLARALYESRPDLQQYFPDPCGRDAVKFLIWVLTYGKKEYRLDEVFLTPLRQQWRAVLDSLNSLPAAAWYRVVFHTMAASVRLRGVLERFGRRIEFGRIALRMRLRSSLQGGEPQAPRRRSRGNVAGLGLNLVGYLRSEMGVGESARCAALAARRIGIPLELKSVDGRGPYRTEDHRAGPDSSTFPWFFNLFHVNADQTPIVFERLGPSFTRGKYNIGYWAWELEDFPDKWRRSFDYFQEIWTPSTFCQEAISRKSPMPVIRIPHAIEVGEPASLGRADFGLPLNRFIFLTVFDMLSVFERKNPLAVVEAFVRAFGNSSSCHLAIKINHADQRPEHLARLRSASAGYSVTVIDRTIDRSELNALIRCCDCLVSLHRSEGFGLPIAEAMYLGKPVIVTAYGGNMDFTNPATAFLISFRLCSVGKGCEPYEEGQRWADPDIAEASEAMRTVYGDRPVRERKALAGMQFVREHLSPEAVGRLMKARLELLASGLS